LIEFSMFSWALNDRECDCRDRFSVLFFYASHWFEMHYWGSLSFQKACSALQSVMMNNI
jgi:hypothetical protein